MATKTKSKPAAPARHDLRIEVGFPLDRAGKAALDAYHAECLAFETAEGELQADWRVNRSDY